MKGKGDMVTFWVESKANRTPPMEEEIKVQWTLLWIRILSPQALVASMAAKKKEEATGGAPAAAAEPAAE